VARKGRAAAAIAWLHTDTPSVCQGAAIQAETQLIDR
jgi:hypothetical protein